MSAIQAERASFMGVGFLPTRQDEPGFWAYFLPNALSASRLVLAALFPLAPTSWRAGIVLAAGATDLLDGWLARLWKSSSAFGRLLDPIADKTFVLMVLAVLLVEGSLAWPVVVLLGLRDWTVLAGTGWLAARGEWLALTRLPPNWWGKAATNTQFAYLLLLLAGAPWTQALLPVAVVLSGAAAFTYARDFLRSRWRPAPSDAA